MKKFILLAAAVVINIAAIAQKIGHTDGQALLFALPEMKTVDETLQKATKEYETALNQMKADYEAKVKEFEANQATWPQAILQSKAKAIQDLEQNIYDLQNTANTDLQAQREQLLLPLIDKVNKAIEEVAKANGFTYIFDSGVGAILYLGGEDATPLIRKQLGLPETPAVVPPAPTPGGTPSPAPGGIGK